MNVNPLIVVNPTSPINTDQTSIVARNIRGEASKENAESTVAPVEESLELQEKPAIEARNRDEVLAARSAEQQIEFLNQEAERESVEVELDQAQVFEESQAFKERLQDQRAAEERQAQQLELMKEVQEKNVDTLNALLTLGAIGVGIQQESDVDEIV